MTFWEACYKNINLVSVAAITDSVYPRTRNVEVAAKSSHKIIIKSKNKKIRCKIITATVGIATDIYLYFQTPKVLLNWGREEERKTWKATMACDLTHPHHSLFDPKGNKSDNTKLYSEPFFLSDY